MQRLTKIIRKPTINMEPIEEETLDYIRLALYGLKTGYIADKIKRSKTTVTNALLHGVGSKETWDELLELAKVVKPELKIPA